MPGADEIKRAAGLAYREAAPGDGRDRTPVLCIHGFPESSYMWRELLPPIAAAGHRAIAPDLPGFGDTPPDPPGTWERHVEAIERFRAELGFDRLVLVLHDWGGLVGMRWACEHPKAIAGLVLSNTGFFPDGKWHGMAQAMRAPGEGEQVIELFGGEALGQSLKSMSHGISDEAVVEYAKGFATPEGRRGALELYRSGDFAKIAAYEGCLAAMEVPAIALWGEEDEFAPIAGAHRFAKELPDCEVVTVEGAGHFVYADDPDRCAAEVTNFLGRVAH